MAYTPGPGRTPTIAATRLVGSSVAALATFVLARWWPLAWSPGSGVVLVLLGIGFLGAVLGIALPMLLEDRPIRVVPVDGGVAIPARRVTMNHVAYILLTTWGLGGVFAAASGLAGPRESPSVTWAAIASVLAFALAYLLLQRPWKRRVELRPDELVLRTGEEATHIPWDDVAAIERAPLLSHARSGMRHMREYNAAAIMVTRCSDSAGRRRRRLADHYPVGDLACPFAELLSALQFLHSHPGERSRVTDPGAAHALLCSPSHVDPQSTPTAHHP